MGKNKIIKVMRRKVAVGLSGGIDSSVAAYLLKRKGLGVVGFTLKFYPQENRCCDLDSLYQAQRLCHALDIPHYVIDTGELFKKEVINYFIDSYLKGLTPNPCSYCNRLIKFGSFLEKIRSLGIDYLATGHYVRLVKKNNTYLFKKSKDTKKTQEYFLSLVNPAILKFLLFPLADYTKQKVKRIARDKGIIFKPRKESQDVCFIQDKNYPDFIEENTPDYQRYAGRIKHTSGDILGKHKGTYYYTLGQRGGLGVSWKEPLYVTAIDSQTKIVTVGEKEFLYRDKFSVHSLNWFVSPKKYKDIKVKVRYRSPRVSCRLKIEGNRAEVNLSKRVDSLTPGQVATFYYQDLVLGGGIIN